jgi:hypothetical protein
MHASPATGRRHGTLVIADISGYTGFLTGVTEAHRDLFDVPEPPQAFGFVSSLLDAIVTEMVPPYALAKFEGDAVFAVCEETGAMPRGEAALDCLRRTYAAFVSRLGHAKEDWTCGCGSCARIDRLDLKFVIHHGDYVVQSIAGHEELLGTEVNAVHRLLKNHARDLVGERPYALFSEAALEALAVPTDGMLAAVEEYESMAPIPVRVLALG